MAGVFSDADFFLLPVVSWVLEHMSVTDCCDCAVNLACVPLSPQFC